MNTKFETQNAIVIRMFDAKEVDKVIHLLLEDGSKMVVFAKGLKKSKSRKAHALDLLNHVAVKTTGKGDMPLLSEAKLLNSATVFKRNYQGLLFTQLICEVLHQLIQEDAEEPGYYRNTENLLGVNFADKLPLLAAAFILRCIYLAGSLPKLNEDFNTGKEIDEGFTRYVSQTDVGYVAEPGANYEAMPDRLFKSQRFMLRAGFSDIQKLQLHDDEQAKLLQIHVNWLQSVTEKELKTYIYFQETL